jgi:peroxiredoxin
LWRRPPPGKSRPGTGTNLSGARRRLLDLDIREFSMTKLNPGDPLPAIALHRTGGATITVPDALAGSYGVVLIYRGSWCPYCNAQLRSFQRSLDKLTGINVKVVALSVDDEPTTKALVDKLRLEFPVGHSADARAVAEATGAFVNPDPVYLQSTGFVLDPQGRVITGVWSNGAIGRLVPEDVIGLIRYVQEHAA